MYRNKTLFVLALAVLALNFLSVRAVAAPLLQEGKKTLYQRIISHPTAVLHAEASDSSEVVKKDLRPFSPLYVYERTPGWLNVGIGTNKADGWIKEGLTTQWNQSLTLLFTNRSQRDPVIFFRDTDALHAICDAEDMISRLESLNEAVKNGTAGPEVVASEPFDSSVDASKFYLMPILDMQDPYEGTKFLRVASIDPGKLEKDEDEDDSEDLIRLKSPSIGIAIVMDTTISMQPYIESCRELFKAIYDRLEEQNLTDHVGFAFVAFRNSTAAVPGVEYVSTIVSDFATVENRQDFEAKLAQVQEAKVSTHSFNEDSLAGVYLARKSLNWKRFDSRLILLVTDAGPLPSDDLYRSVAMEPQEMADFVRSKGIWLVTVHIKSPSGAKNHDYAEQAYKTLSMLGNGPLYYRIESKTPNEGARYFNDVADKITQQIEDFVIQTKLGILKTKPDDEMTPTTPEEEATLLAQRLGYAMQLEYLGRKNKTRVPELVSSWISDMDLVKLAQGQRVPSVEVAVLLTKAQLSDLHAQVTAILDSAERTKKTASKDFFQGILSVSARATRDPNIPTTGKNLAELGILGEYLEGLPYQSEVMLLTEEDWNRKSVGEMQSFINRLRSKLALYEEYERDQANWEDFNLANPNDSVYRVPLNMLP